MYVIQARITQSKRLIFCIILCSVIFILLFLSTHRLMTHTLPTLEFLSQSCGSLVRYGRRCHGKPSGDLHYCMSSRPLWKAQRQNYLLIFHATTLTCSFSSNQSSVFVKVEVLPVLIALVMSLDMKRVKKFKFLVVLRKTDTVKNLYKNY